MIGIVQALTVAAVSVILCKTAAGQEQMPAPAFLEITVAQRECFVQQAIEVQIRAGVDTGFLARQIVRGPAAPREFPLRLDIPFWAAANAGYSFLPGTVAVDGTRCVLNGRFAPARLIGEIDRNGRRYLVIELRGTLLPTIVGTIDLPTCTLHFEHAERFRDDFVHGRVPIDVRSDRVGSAPLRLAVRALPDADRPASFGGAVGRFEIDVTTEARAVRVGDSMQFTLRIRGEGNLHAFAAPRPELPGFHVRGHTESKEPGIRLFTYDITPSKADLYAVPAFAFSFFDPQVGRYRSVETKPLPLKVTAASATGVKTTEAGAPEGDVADRQDIDDANTRAPGAVTQDHVLGRKAYAAGQYERAAAYFSKAAGQPDTNLADLWLDLGNTAWRLQRPALACLFYRRAERAQPFDQIPRHNLRLASGTLGIAYRGIGWAGRLRRWLAGLSPLSFWSVMAAAAIVALIAGRRSRRAALIGLSLTAILGVGRMLARTVPGDIEGIVLEPSAIRVDPHPELPSTGELRPGEMITVREMSDRWIRFEVGPQQGWVECRGIGIIDSDDAMIPTR